MSVPYLELLLESKVIYLQDLIQLTYRYRFSNGTKTVFSFYLDLQTELGTLRYKRISYIVSSLASQIKHATKKELVSKDSLALTELWYFRTLLALQGSILLYPE